MVLTSLSRPILIPVGALFQCWSSDNIFQGVLACDLHSISRFSNFRKIALCKSFLAEIVFEGWFFVPGWSSPKVFLRFYPEKSPGLFPYLYALGRRLIIVSLRLYSLIKTFLFSFFKCLVVFYEQLFLESTCFFIYFFLRYDHHFPQCSLCVILIRYLYIDFLT